MTGIIFKEVSIKNFLSIGNEPVVISLDQSMRTLISGKNGSGKSTILSAILFAIFNKTERKITKDKVVNHINKNNCFVSLKFIKDNKEYLIERGVKPSLLRISIDGVEEKADADAKTTQDRIENEYLGFNYSTFMQVVILPSANYEPFMRLPLPKRREVVETILDISIFSKMNASLKESMKLLMEEFKTTNYEMDIINTKIESEKKLSTSLKESWERTILNLEDDLIKLHKTDTDLNCDLNALKNQVVNIGFNRDDIQYKIDQFSHCLNKSKSNTTKLKYEFESESKDSLSQLNSSLNICRDSYVKLKTKIHNYALLKVSECEICGSVITEEHKKTHEEKLLLELDEFKNEGTTLKNQYDNLVKEISIKKEKYFKELHDKESEYIKGLDEEINESKRKLQEIDNYLNKIKNIEYQISCNKNVMNDKNREIKSYRDKISSIKNTDLDVLNQQKNNLMIKHTELSNDINVHKISLEMLKDEGIKANIIKEYLVHINKRLNFYLDKLGFHSKVIIDEEFNETILREYDSEYSYESFSEGEKQRIDLAFLFTWREIATFKNTFFTNLLIMDETLDASIDADGVDNIFYIMDEILKDVNLFVISHKGEMVSEHFNNKIEVYKNSKGFSVYKFD